MGCDIQFRSEEHPAHKETKCFEISHQRNRERYIYIEREREPKIFPKKETEKKREINREHKKNN